MYTGLEKKSPKWKRSTDVISEPVKLPISEMVKDGMPDATMDELEADIQRRLNLIKESLAKLDAPVPEVEKKTGKN